MPVSFSERLRALPGEPLCWDLLGYCRCGREAGHRGRHACNGCELTWESEHRSAGLRCWCNPAIEHYRNADVVIHNEGDDA